MIDEALAAPASAGSAAEGAADAAPAIEVRGLTFTYPGQDAPVLVGVDWTVPAGAFALLVGGTGSGKSTLLALLKPEIAPTGSLAGTRRVLGDDIERLDPRASARTVGYVFQRPENQIVCESVWHEMAFCLENLGVPTDEMRRHIAETSYFFGIDDWFRRDTATLSGGRKQLLALAATLVAEPRVLVLDEPTAQLDPIAEKNFLHALFRINRELGCTVVVATHRPRAMVDYATCAFALRAGKVEEIASLEPLRRREVLMPAGSPAQGAVIPPAKDAASATVCGDGSSMGGGASAAPASSPARGARSSRAAGEAQPRRGAAAASLDRVWFRYERDADWVLRGLELAVRPGALHALVGGNGCGKSTLLALLAGLKRPQRGRMRVAARTRALLPQDPRALFAAETVRGELMEWSGSGGYDAAEARALAAEAGLGWCLDRHPYDLSGGQQQLLALCKLLLIEPEVLLLDEPTKGLDLAGRRLVARLLRAACDRGATVVMATHDLDAVEQLADEVSMVFDGEVACTAASEEFFRGNVYYRP